MAKDVKFKIRADHKERTWKVSSINFSTLILLTKVEISSNKETAKIFMNGYCEINLNGLYLDLHLANLE